MDGIRQPAARTVGERGLIALGEAIRTLTCRHLLGAIPAGEYRAALDGLLAECRQRCPPRRPSEAEDDEVDFCLCD